MIPGNILTFVTVDNRSAKLFDTRSISRVPGNVTVIFNTIIPSITITRIAGRESEKV